MYVGLHVKYPLFVSDFNETLRFIDRVSKNPQVSNFVKIRPVLWGRTDTAKLLGAYVFNVTYIPGSYSISQLFKRGKNLISCVTENTTSPSCCDAV
jgi:hypothetical protein